MVGMQHHFQHGRDWSKLYPDVLQLICQNLTDLIDFVNFRAVCKGWRTTILASDYSKQPWLCWDCNAYEGVNFYRLTSMSQWTEIRVPIIRTEKSILGFSQGYMLILDFKDYRNFKKLAYYLLNPITGKQIHLPPLDDWFCSLVDVELDGGVPKRVAVCESDQVESCVSILRICQIGDEKWTTVYRECSPLIRCTFYKSSLFLTSSFHTKVIDAKPGVAVSIIAPPVTKCRFRLCSPCGSARDLLGITITSGPIDFEFLLFEFEIYHLDDRNGNTRWIKTDNIGDQVVFWSSFKCYCWKTHDSSMYKRNSVYYRSSKGLGRFDIENATAEIVQREPPDGYLWFPPTLV